MDRARRARPTAAPDSPLSGPGASVSAFVMGCFESSSVGQLELAGAPGLVEPRSSERRLSSQSLLSPIAPGQGRRSPAVAKGETHVYELVCLTSHRERGRGLLLGAAPSNDDLDADSCNTVTVLPIVPGNLGREHAMVHPQSYGLLPVSSEV